MKTSSALAIIFLIALGALLQFSLYIVPEGKQVVILQFGKVIPPAITDAGLYFKLPWREARLLEKRLLNWDGTPSEIATREKKYINVDTTARYRIQDPILFMQELVDISQAQNRLQTWINNATREAIANHNLVETVRNTNDIIDKQASVYTQNRKRTSEEEEKVSLEGIADEEISGELEPITVGRELLTQKIIEKARQTMGQYGLELVDVQLKRVALEETVEQEVYKRMISERERIAEKIRSVGRRERAKIQGRTQKELSEIQSASYLRVQQVKGEAEAKAIAIYASALQRNPKFYQFLRNLEMLENSVSEKTAFILSPDSDVLSLLKNEPTLK